MARRNIPYDELKGTTDLRGFVEDAEAMRDEFDGLEGNVTCEFSTGGDRLAEKIQLLAKMPVKFGFWRVFWCDTCFEHHGSAAPFHCELIPLD